MPPVWYWETVADKLSAAELVMGLLQRGHTRRLALGCCCAQNDGKRYIIQSDELASAVLELEKTLLVILRAPFFYSSELSAYWLQSQNHQSKFIFRLVSAVS